MRSQGGAYEALRSGMDVLSFLFLVASALVMFAVAAAGLYELVAAVLPVFWSGVATRKSEAALVSQSVVHALELIFIAPLAFAVPLAAVRFLNGLLVRITGADATAEREGLADFLAMKALTFSLLASLVAVFAVGQFLTGELSLLAVFEGVVLLVALGGFHIALERLSRAAH